ncbi:predicted protein [Postia placenta Mad-698-R]|nr:predicted protein [Postia placenta Mad-698-R]
MSTVCCLSLLLPFLTPRAISRHKCLSLRDDYSSSAVLTIERWMGIRISYSNIPQLSVACFSCFPRAWYPWAISRLLSTFTPALGSGCCPLTFDTLIPKGYLLHALALRSGEHLLASTSANQRIYCRRTEGLRTLEITRPSPSPTMSPAAAFGLDAASNMSMFKFNRRLPPPRDELTMLFLRMTDIFWKVTLHDPFDIQHSSTHRLRRTTTTPRRTTLQPSDGPGNSVEDRGTTGSHSQRADSGRRLKASSPGGTSGAQAPGMVESKIKYPKKPTATTGQEMGRRQTSETTARWGGRLFARSHATANTCTPDWSPGSVGPLNESSLAKRRDYCVLGRSARAYGGNSTGETARPPRGGEVASVRGSMRRPTPSLRVSWSLGTEGPMGETSLAKGETANTTTLQVGRPAWGSGVRIVRAKSYDRQLRLKFFDRAWDRGACKRRTATIEFPGLQCFM